jgi:PBP1b-binding outer membrane lipoprotein LpoB
MKKMYIILGILSILLLSGCLDNTKNNANVNGENVSAGGEDTNYTANSTDSENFTYPVGANITEDGKEIVS